ncbi:MAG: hypothetical protein JNK82_06145 [Myxococcaceae bacterium]|nr:hypothetical protein [Myxococcaceae bacterium]
MRLGSVMVFFAVCGCSGGSAVDGGTGGSGGTGQFTYTFEDRVYRVEARVGAMPENVSTRLNGFGMGARDRWLTPSVDGAWLVLSTDRISCSMGECLTVAPRDLSTLTLVAPGGTEVSLEGHAAINAAGDTIVYPSGGGPHTVDLWLTKKSGMTWQPATLLTGSSTAAFNNMPALSLDGQRVLFDCGTTRDAETGVTDACEVQLDGSGLRVVARPTTLANGRNTFVQFPHDSVDGVLFQGSWPIGAETPETIWLQGKSGAPTPIGSALTNAVSPCGLRDGRWGVLWLSRPGNTTGAHELSLMARDGGVLGALTPGVDVQDIGIGCSD